MTDVIIGAIQNYRFDDIRVYCDSLDNSGYTGDKVMICYDGIDRETILELRRREYYTLPGTPLTINDNIVVKRFFDIYETLCSAKITYDRVILTDVRDLIFQRNPSEGLDKFLSGYGILASGEGFRYRDEPWSDNNMKLAFPQHYDDMQDKPINCAGVIAGTKEEIVALVLDMYFKCMNIPQRVLGGGGPDQSAYNILLQSKHFYPIVRWLNANDDWACNVGTTSLAIKAGYGEIGQRAKHDPSAAAKYAELRLDKDPVVQNGKLCTYRGEPYYIVHQYDRAAWFPVPTFTTTKPDDTVTIKVIR